VDAFSISNYGSAMFAQVQPQHSPLMLLTPLASAASLGYAGLQAARRNTRFARYCEENTLADAPFSQQQLFSTTIHFSRILSTLKKRSKRSANFPCALTGCFAAIRHSA
jgi:hypothetical protein